MTQIQPAESTGTLKKLAIKVIGVGGAGGNVVAHMAREGLAGVSFACVNTDGHALAECGVGETLVLGAALSRGLSAGGDPEMGRAAAEQDLEALRQLCRGADIIFLAAGLGGGTGTGAAPVVARIAKETGALVLALVTLPFEFEGTRRFRQAQAGLQQLKSRADSVICLPNQKLFKLIAENTSFQDTFRLSNDLLAQGVRGIWRLLTQTGLMNVDFADLSSVTRDRHGESTFASVEVKGENRGQVVMEKLLAHPLLEGGCSLAQADAVLISLVGGSDMAMSDINRVMEQINRQCETAHIIMGAAIDESFQGRLMVTLVASRRGDRPVAPAETSSEARNLEGGRLVFDGLASPLMHSAQEETPRSTPRFVPPAPVLSVEKKEELYQRQQGGGSKWSKASRLRQAQLPLEIVSKGRFEKSEPTIHEGEDLDVPTYIRRGVALN